MRYYGGGANAKAGQAVLHIVCSPRADKVALCEQLLLTCRAELPAICCLPHSLTAAQTSSKSSDDLQCLDLGEIAIDAEKFNLEVFRQ